MVRYVLLRPLRPELDAKTKTRLPAKTRFSHLDEQAMCGAAVHFDYFLFYWLFINIAAEQRSNSSNSIFSIFPIFELKFIIAHSLKLGFQMRRYGKKRGDMGKIKKSAEIWENM
jgi:hypothetical protein